MQYFDEFADEFFFVVLFICLILIFCDWLIGQEGKRAMRGKISEWWILVDDAPFTGFVNKDARYIVSFIEALVGTNWGVPKRFIRIFIFSVASTLLVSALVDVGSNQSHLVHDYTVYILLPVNLIATSVSLTITLIFLRKISASNSRKLISLFVIADLFFVFLLFLFSMISIAIVGTSFYGLSENIYTGQSTIGQFFSSTTNLISSFIINIFWSVAHIISMLAFFVSRYFGPVIKPIVSLLLYRFQESEKGVLTLLSIGLGALLKILQQAYKVFV